MKVTLQQLFLAHPAFELLGMQFFALDKIIPARNLFEEINTHYAAIAQKQEQLLAFYGIKNDEGKWDVADDKKAFYENELNEFLSTEVELDWEPANVDDLGDIRMPMAAFELLEFLFVTEEVPVK